MTDAKKLKRKIRERAARTGESYNAARRHVLSQVDQKRQARSQAAAADARDASATGAVSEARCIEVTGHGFDHWFAVLDRFGSPKQGHKESARHLQQDHGVSAWYSQSITVLYERARGLRTLNQASAGGYQVSVSRTLAAQFVDASKVLTEHAARDPWLAAIEPELGAAIAEAAETKVRAKEGAVWIRYRAQPGVVELRISAMADGRAKAVVRVEQLPDKASVEPQRSQWRQALDALKRHTALT